MARELERLAGRSAVDRSYRPGGPRRAGWAAVAVAAVAAMVLAGCGSGSAEPQDKKWDEGDSQSQQSGKDDQGDQDGKSDDQGSDGDGDTVVEDGDDSNQVDEDTKAEVEQFVQEYLDAQNAATKDGDFSRVEPFIENCQVCAESRAYIEGAYDDGGRVEGGLFTKPKIDASAERDGRVTVTVVSTISAYKTIDGSGTEVESGPAEDQTYQYSVAEKDGEWKLVAGRFVN